MNNNLKPETKYLIGGIAVIVVFILGYFVWARVVLHEETSLSSLLGTERAKLPEPGTTPDAATTTPTAPAPAVRPPTSASSNYEKALNEYRTKGAYFQFVNCAGNPGTLTLKRGTIFMLDNRDNEAHKIKVGSITYNVAAYGYKLVNPQKLGINTITCDGGGAASVNVQR